MYLEPIYDSVQADRVPTNRVALSIQPWQAGIFHPSALCRAVGDQDPDHSARPQPVPNRFWVSCAWDLKSAPANVRYRLGSTTLHYRDPVDPLDRPWGYR